jgi:hypothetical protein
VHFCVVSSQHVYPKSSGYKCKMGSNAQKLQLASCLVFQTPSQCQSNPPLFPRSIPPPKILPRPKVHHGRFGAFCSDKRRRTASGLKLLSQFFCCLHKVRTKIYEGVSVALEVFLGAACSEGPVTERVYAKVADPSSRCNTISMELANWDKKWRELRAETGA